MSPEITSRLAAMSEATRMAGLHSFIRECLRLAKQEKGAEGVSDTLTVIMFGTVSSIAPETWPALEQHCQHCQPCGTPGCDCHKIKTALYKAMEAIRGLEELNSKQSFEGVESLGGPGNPIMKLMETARDEMNKQRV